LSQKHGIIKKNCLDESYLLHLISRQKYYDVYYFLLYLMEYFKIISGLILINIAVNYFDYIGPE